MKIYSRILGIATFLITIFFLCVLIYFLFAEADESREKLLALIGLMPIYIVMHFIIIHRFGFSFKEDLGRQGSIVLTTSLVLFTMFTGLITWQIIDVVKLTKEEEIAEKDSEELLSHLAKTRTFDKQTSAYGFAGEIQTKFFRDELLYKLVVTSKKPFDPNSVVFTVEFQDKDGFLIRSINIDDYVRVVKDDKVFGIVANSKIVIDSPWEFGAEEIKNIADWRLLVSNR